MTPLICAIDTNWVEGVRALIEAGADPSFNATLESNPFISAIKVGSMEIVEILLQAGADVNGSGCLYNPLIEAIRENKLQHFSRK